MKKESRHGKRAEGKTQTSITLSKETLERGRAAAAKENRSFSNWLEILLQEKTAKLTPESKSEKSGEGESGEDS